MGISEILYYTLFLFPRQNVWIVKQPDLLKMKETRLYNSLSSTLIFTTSIFKFDAIPARNSTQLCSTRSNPLYIPQVKTKSETRAFSVAALTVWNLLRASAKSEGNIVSFCRHQKPISLMLPILLSPLASSSIH